MKNIKRLIIPFFMLVACSFGLFADYNFDSNSEELLGMVYVEDELLSEEQIFELNQLAWQCSEGNYCGIYVAIINDMNDYGYYDIEECCENLYTQNNLGVGNENNGVFLLLSLAERDYVISAYGSKGNYSFTNYGKKQIFKEIKDDLKNDNWYVAIKTFIEQSYYCLVMANEGNPVDVASNNEFSNEGVLMDYGKLILISVVIAFIIALIVCFILRAPMKNVKLAKYAEDYVISNGIRFKARSDHYSHRTTSRVKINNDSNNGSSGSSSGFSHSSGKF